MEVKDTLCYIINIMADDLAVGGSRISTTVVLTEFPLDYLRHIFSSESPNAVLTCFQRTLFVVRIEVLNQLLCLRGIKI